MNYYPVVIPTLNRYEHFKECIESLSMCTHADKTELVIGLDYPPTKKYEEGWKKIKNYIPTIQGFKKITIFEHEHNLGPEGNSDFLRQYVFKYNNAYIFTEDDNIFSPCFLDYMDKCLEKYKDDSNIACITGCLTPEIKNSIKDNKSNNSVLKIIGNTNAYGIGLWSSKEKSLKEKFPEDFRKYIFSSRKNIIKLLKSPAKLNHIFFWIKKDKSLNRICDFTRNAWMVLNNQTTIMPIISLVRNNGFDGTGLHCDESSYEQNLWLKLNISENKTYEILEGYSKKEINKISNKLFKTFNKQEVKDILPIILIYMVLGYNISEYLLNKIHDLKIKH